MLLKSPYRYHYNKIASPFVSYDSINYNGSRLAKVLSFRDFDRDIRGNTLPQYIHVSPNMLNDGHDTSPSFAIDWVYNFLNPLLSNAEFMNRTLILLTYDESGTMTNPNHITSILLGGAIPKNLHGTVDNTFYSHYSILSTLENNWDLPCLGRYDVGANVFSFVASQTNHTNKISTEFLQANYSLSYPGFLNDNPSKYLPIPPPNVKLIGAGGQGVARIIQDAWKSSAKSNTPYDGSGMLYDGGDGHSNIGWPMYRPPAPNMDLNDIQNKKKY